MSKLLAVVVLVGIWAEAGRAFGQVALQPTNQTVTSVLDDTVHTNRLDEFGEGSIGIGNSQVYSDRLSDAPQALWEVYPGVGETQMSGINPNRSIYRRVYKPVYRSVYRPYGHPSAYRR